MGNIGLPELLIILFVALIFFGPGKLPQLGKSLGQAISEYKNATTEIKKQVTEVVMNTDEREK
ncbi:MAG: twin-arginine translocase TatA/TatE family subunit [Candidatus Saccharibacteria bacterium]